MTPKDTDKALDYRLSEYRSKYPIDIAYPSVSYEPRVGTAFLTIDYLHGESYQVELGTESDDRDVGIYQITLNTENNRGSLEASTIITQLKEFFKRGTVASYNGLNVRITNFSLGSYDSSGDWYREVVNITYRADLAN